jgi:hypothetical protein
VTQQVLMAATELVNKKLFFKNIKTKK